uniref:CAP domain-containing protein (inferred by orthology to a zebrafish protein) n=1 Tax=Strongyloides venezuelensis TaxID=75913 RepID=A0A0K0FCZ8_STRVS
MDPPPLPKKTRSYSNVGNPPPLPLKAKNNVINSIPPILPLKSHSYNKYGRRVIASPQSTAVHKVRSYSARGMKLFECNRITFYNQEEAKAYCQTLNNFRGSMAGNYHWQYTPNIGSYRNSLSRSKSDLTNRKKSILESHNFVKGRKHSSSGSRNSLSGLSRSSSSQSITHSFDRLSLKKNSVSGSKSSLSSMRSSVSGSSNDLSTRRNSLSRSISNLSGRRRSSSSERRNSQSSSKESLINNAVGNKIGEDLFAKKTRRKPKSHMIWLKVWNDCNAMCYSKNQFEVYKGLVSLEINMYRLIHRVNRLKLKSQLSVIAQELTEIYAVKQKIDSDLYPNYGILYGKSSIASASTIVKSWYETSRKYNFLLSKPSSTSALSFTQIVWGSTTEFGIGVKDDNGYLFLVCVFYPKGNQKGKFRKNVHRLTSKKFFDKD